MPTEPLFSQTEVDDMNQPLNFMPLKEPMELPEHCDGIMARGCGDHRTLICLNHQQKCLKVFDETSPQNQKLPQLSIDLGVSILNSTGKELFDQSSTAKEADENGDEKIFEFPLMKRSNRRVHQHGPSEARCTSPRINCHASDSFRSTNLKGESRTAQQKYGRHFIRSRTTSKKLIWLAILASVTVPVISTASVAHYFDATVLASGMLANIPSICVGTNLIPPSHGSLGLAILWYGSPTSLTACSANKQQDYHLWACV